MSHLIGCTWCKGWEPLYKCFCSIIDAIVQTLKLVQIPNRTMYSFKEYRQNLLAHTRALTQFHWHFFLLTSLLAHTRPHSLHKPQTSTSTMHTTTFLSKHTSTHTRTYTPLLTPLTFSPLHTHMHESTRTHACARRRTHPPPWRCAHTVICTGTNHTDTGAFPPTQSHTHCTFTREHPHTHTHAPPILSSDGYPPVNIRICPAVRSATSTPHKRQSSHGFNLQAARGIRAYFTCFPIGFACCPSACCPLPSAWPVHQTARPSARLAHAFHPAGLPISPLVLPIRPAFAHPPA